MCDDVSFVEVFSFMWTNPVTVYCCDCFIRVFRIHYKTAFAGVIAPGQYSV